MSANQLSTTRPAVRFWIALGAASAALAVVAGAFGAHALAEHVTEARLHTWNTAATYHLIHSLALCLCGAVAGVFPTRTVSTASALIAIGIAAFSGSLYALVLLDMPELGAITPVGGVAFISGWLALAAGVWRGGR